MTKMTTFVVATGGVMQRRVFILEAGKAVPAVVGALYLIGCGDSTVTPSVIADIKSDSTVVNGHFHTVNVSSSDQMKGVTTAYTSSAALSHDHMVTLSASQLTTLGQQGTVTVTSTNSTVTGNHSHDFTFQGKKI